jgi:hypothetical protein
MSKSLGNLVFVSDLRSEWDPRAIRLARSSRTTTATHGSGRTTDARGPGPARALARGREGDGALDEVRAALDDDLDTPAAVAAIDALRSPLGTVCRRRRCCSGSICSTHPSSTSAERRHRQRARPAVVDLDVPARARHREPPATSAGVSFPSCCGPVTRSCAWPDRPSDCRGAVGRRRRGRARGPVRSGEPRPCVRRSRCRLLPGPLDRHRRWVRGREHGAARAFAASAADGRWWCSASSTWVVCVPPGERWRRRTWRRGPRSARSSSTRHPDRGAPGRGDHRLRVGVVRDAALPHRTAAGDGHAAVGRPRGSSPSRCATSCATSSAPSSSIPTRTGRSTSAARRVDLREMMQRYAAVAGLRRRLIVPVPVLSPPLSSHWINLVTPVPKAIARR